MSSPGSCDSQGVTASRGYLEEVSVDSSGLDLTTRYETDARGNVKAQFTPRAVRHEWEYNELDWLVETRQAVTGSSDGAPCSVWTMFRY